MRVRTQHVFDEWIAGTGTTWYSSSDFENVIEGGDMFAVQACTTDVVGTSPTLTVDAEVSDDGEHWVGSGTPQISGGITENGSLMGSVDPFVFPPLSRLRFKITLGQSDAGCRLMLYVTVRGTPGRGTSRRVPPSGAMEGVPR